MSTADDIRAQYVECIAGVLGLDMNDSCDLAHRIVDALAAEGRLPIHEERRGAFEPERRFVTAWQPIREHR